MIRAVLFDFDGVFFPNRFGPVFSKIKNDFSIPESLYQNKSFQKKYAKIRDESLVGIHSFEEEMRAFDELLNIPKGASFKEIQAFDSAHEIFDGVISLVEKIATQNISTGILTDNTDNFEKRFVPRFGLENFFDYIFNSWHLKLSKKNNSPEIFEVVVERMEMKPREIIFVDDKKENILGAENAGMYGIKFKYTEDDLQRLEKKIFEKIERENA